MSDDGCKSFIELVYDILVGQVGIDDGPETCDKISVGGLTSAGWFGGRSADDEQQ